MRKDIQALRAIAVLAVLAFHLSPKRLTGGFVGVDIFFVISGYLITGHLAKELFKKGSISISRFYVRRAIRLLPSALLVLMVTGWLILTFTDSGLFEIWMPQLASSAFYVENWHLSALAVDYLGGDVEASPVQHFWTLSVEEQFYIFMPLILIAAAKLAKPLKVRVRTAVLFAIGLIMVSSFVYCVYLTDANQPLAYFNTFARAWEFAHGALLAILPLRENLAPKLLRPVALVLIAASLFFVNGLQGFPGAIALLPVVGAALWLIAAPAKASWFDRALTPIGNISYSLYLWHWPAIVILPYITGRELIAVDKLGILLFSIAAATASTYLLENRVRFGEKLEVIRRPKVTAIWATSLMTLVAIFSLQFLPSNATPTAKPTDPAQAATYERCLGAGSLDPANQPCDFEELKDLLLPDLNNLMQDDGNRPDCWNSNNAEYKQCVLGLTSGYTKRFYAVGDSHLSALIETLNKIAVQNNWRIDLAAKGSCYLTSAELRLNSKQDEKDCAAWRANILPAIEQIADLDGIIVTHHADSRAWAKDGKSEKQALIDGQVAAWNSRPDLNVPIIAILDNPSIKSSTIACLKKYKLQAGSVCSADIKVTNDGQREAAKKAKNAKVVDLTEYFCPEGVCRAVIGNVVVYRDRRAHITETFALTLTPYLEAQIKQAIAAN